MNESLVLSLVDLPKSARRRTIRHNPSLALPGPANNAPNPGTEKRL
jgi:hypothetical protein